mmetsp:Transcript_42178/g.117442  ORF Transcript_42178/g.117442 Transcript_42178/m.117442 type:complete len:234 (-) Transcript_42178:1549-2250(-)
MTTLLKSDSRASRAPPTPPSFLSSSRMRPQRPRLMAAEIHGGATAQSLAEARPRAVSRDAKGKRPEAAVSTLENKCCISAREIPRGKADAASSHCSAVISRSPGFVNSKRASANGSPAASSLRRRRANTREQPCCESETRRSAAVRPLRFCDAHVKKVAPRLMSTMVRVPDRSCELPRACAAGPGSGGMPGGAAGDPGLPGSGGMPGGMGGASGPEGCGGGARGAPKVLANSA